MEKYVIVRDVLKKIKRYNLTGRNVEFKLKPVPENVDAVGWVKDGINQIITSALEGVESEDMVGITFCSKEFQRGDGWINFQRASNISYEDIWSIISNIYQSNSSGLNTESFCLGITSVRLPTGRGRGKQYNNFEEECGKRRGIITINNKDNLCLPRALVVAAANMDKDPDFRKISRDIGKVQTKRANKLLSDACVTIPEEGAGIPELQQFQRHLQDYQIVVYKYGSKGRDVIFEGVAESSKKINLLHHEGHFNVITSLTAAFVCTYFCEACHVPYNNKSDHRCGGVCHGCQQSPPCPKEFPVCCENCFRTFKSNKCFENHKNSVCASVHRCRECLKTVKTDREHNCGEIFCRTCQKHCPKEHLCYMQIDTRKPKTENTLFIFYDLETMQQKIVNEKQKLHEPNMCVYSQRCDNCLNEPKLYFCQKCGFRTKVLKVNVIQTFIDYILTIRKNFKAVIILAHNGSSFDNQFLLNYMITKSDLTPELITRGTKLVLMQLENVKFLDSINYFPMKLAKLPKVFGLNELKKGYFPYLFNTLENQSYVGVLPAIEHYSPDTMGNEERKKFLEWYETHKNDLFDMQRELEEYCISDVEILTQACLKFRTLLMKEGNVCPFTEAVTLPGACNKIFRRNFLKPDTIGLIPKNGYRWRDQQSKIAVQWLIWEEHQGGNKILHAANGRETTIGGHKVDGYCAENKTVYEFYGCYYHGCPVCFKCNRDTALHDNPDETLNLRYERTLSKTTRLRDLEYEVVEKWECEFNRFLEDNSDAKSYVDNHTLLVHLPLNPRDAFYGGRTGGVSGYRKAEDGEKIKYMDVCSLYPWVCKYGKYPVGHPEVIVGVECKTYDLTKTEGLIKAKVLPPHSLFHPVLPLKMNNKLMFILCRKCGEEMNKSGCTHTEDERTLTGTWVIDEVLKAIEKGYIVLEIYEIWKYNVVQDAHNSSGLFTEYINKFLKIKQQASGWPSDCITEEHKIQYVKEYLDRENVVLNPNDIEFNPGLRQLGKAVITSFWGKLGQKENQGKTSLINNTEEFFNMLTNPAIIVNTVLPVHGNDSTLIVNWMFREESYRELSTVNVCLAAYTTAQARLKLYSYLESLEERVLYYDTDSVIYTYKEGQTDIPKGSFLGEMTDELEGYGPGSYITDFVCGGPKQYAYIVYSPSLNKYHEVCKVKGIAINHEVSQTVNFNTLQDMVLDDKPPVYITSSNIRRTKIHEVVTEKQQKIFRLNFRKRILLDNYTSVPYGYKKIKTV